MTTALTAFRLDGMVALITGGARGIGRATAESFLSVGARVHLCDRDADEVMATAAALGENCFGHVMDVTDEARIDQVFNEIAAAEGHVDILVNNAGLGIRAPTTELTLPDWQTVIDINLTGAFLCARAAGRVMVPQGSGAIINVASIMGMSGGGMAPNISYQATKGAMVNMTRGMAVEWAPKGIRVNAVAPTWVETGLLGGLKNNADFMSAIERLTPARRMALPEEVAHAIHFLAAPASAMVIGHILAVDGGYLAQ